jgi:hypothetical protein
MILYYLPQTPLPGGRTNGSLLGLERAGVPCRCLETPQPSYAPSLRHHAPRGLEGGTKGGGIGDGGLGWRTLCILVSIAVRVYGWMYACINTYILYIQITHTNTHKGLAGLHVYTRPWAAAARRAMRRWLRLIDAATAEEEVATAAWMLGDDGLRCTCMCVCVCVCVCVYVCVCVCVCVCVYRRYLYAEALLEGRQHVADEQLQFGAELLFRLDHCKQLLEHRPYALPRLSCDHQTQCTQLRTHSDKLVSYYMYYFASFLFVRPPGTMHAARYTF